MGRSKGAVGGVRRDTRLRFEQWARNPGCQANALSALYHVSMAEVARAEGLESTFGQSPFAIARGNLFERTLFAEDTLIKALIKAKVLPEGVTGLADMRTRKNGGPRADLDEAIEATLDLLKTVARDRKGPCLAAGATLVLPQRSGLPEAVLILDALAIRTDGERPCLLVGEIKTYPDRGGHTDGGELATARAQAGLYRYALGETVEALGLQDRIQVEDRGFLVLSRPGGNQPSVRAGEDLRYQAERARRGFELLAQSVETVQKAHEDPFQAVREAETHYCEGCLAFCDRAARCHSQAMTDGDPAVLGEDVRRFLGDIDLHRALQLMDGAKPQNATEEDLVERLSDLEGMLRR